jgi:translocation and assembly module TamB
MAPRRRTIVLGTAAVLLSLLVLVVGGVVALTMTERGMGLMVRAVLPAVRQLVPGTLYVGAVRGNLFTDITIDTLELTAPDGTPFLSSGPIRVTYDPRDLLDSRIVIKSLDVTRPRLTLVDYGNDDWNLWRALGRRKASTLPRRRSRLGQYIVIDTTSVRELTFVARLPWLPSDTLRGAVRDSVIDEHLSRLTDEFRREDGRLVKVMRFMRGSLELGRSRIADPDSAGLRMAIRRLDVVWNSPPLWFKDLRGDARILKDTLWMDRITFGLPQSTASGSAKVVWGSGLPMRYDIRLTSDSVAMSDLAWVSATIPHSGGGKMDLTIRNDPQQLSIMEYIITNMDARSLKSRIVGNMTWGVGGPTTRLTDVDLSLQPAHTQLLQCGGVAAISATGVSTRRRWRSPTSMCRGRSRAAGRPGCSTSFSPPKRSSRASMSSSNSSTCGRHVSSIRSSPKSTASRRGPCASIRSGTTRAFRRLTSR